MPTHEISKTLILFGAILILTGLAFALLEKVSGAGRLPGDILIRKGNFTFYFPLASSLVVSVLLSLVFYWMGKR